MYLHWIGSTRSAKKHSINAIFPNTYPLSSHAKFSSARRFLKLRKEIGSEGFDLSSVASRCIKQGIEVDRWKQLAQLKKAITAYSVKNLIDPTKLNIKTAEEYQLDSAISKSSWLRHLILKPLPLKALQSLESKTPIEIWINGPEKEGPFNPWGIPEQKL